MEHERAAADRRAVDPGRHDAEIGDEFGWDLARRGEAVDVGRLQTAAGLSVERGVSVQLELRHACDPAELVCPGRSDAGDIPSQHRGPNTLSPGRPWGGRS